jgi:WD40 repeat protein
MTADRTGNAASSGVSPVTAAEYAVFLSYSSADRPLVVRIARHLRRHGIEPWIDRWRLVPGAEWQSMLNEGLAGSQACAVFVGTELGAWERAEVQVAVDRSVRNRRYRTFPVLLPGVDPFDPNDLPPFLATRTWVDFRKGPDDPGALRDLIHAVKGIPYGPDPVSNPVDGGTSPYRGLLPFYEEHAEFFFGRDGDLQRLAERLKSTNLVTVLGPSGSGKSSLVCAGLIPLLRNAAAADRPDWLIRVLRPGSRPLAAIAAQLLTLTAERSMNETVDQLATDRRTLHLSTILGLRDRPPGTRLLLVIDQFEEIFTLCPDEDERRRLLDNLHYAASVPGGPTTFVLTLRGDFYPRLAKYRDAAQLIQANHLLLGTPDTDELRQIIESPAWRVGLEIEAGLTDTILADVSAEPGILPLLQQALRETWRNRRGSTLSLEGYQSAGGVRRALADRAELIFAGLDGPAQQFARQLFLRLTQPGESAGDSRRRVDMDELAGPGDPQRHLADQVLPVFIEERLLTAGSDDRTGQEWVEVSHEALIRAWPRLRDWINADRAGLRIHRGLTEAAYEWRRRGRDEDVLFRGSRLAEAVEWEQENPLLLNVEEQAFLTAGQLLDNRLKRSRQRRVQMIVTSLVVALVVISSVALVAVQQGREAARQRDIAVSRDLAGQAMLRLDIDPAQSVSLAERALQAAPTAQAEESLRQATLESRHRQVLTGHTGRVLSIDTTPDGRLVSAGDDGAVRIWRLTDGALLDTIPTRQGIIYAVAFGPDGRSVATAGSDATVALIDLQDRQPRTVLRGAEQTFATTLAFLPGSGTLLAGFSDGWLRSTGVPAGGADPAPADAWPAHRAPIYALARGADGSSVASASTDGDVHIWRPGKRNPERTFGGHRGGALGASFDPRGELIATADADGFVRVWETATGRLTSEFRADDQSIYSIAFTRDGRQLLTAGEDGQIILWSTSGTRLQVMHGHLGNVYRAVLDPVDGRIVSAGQDGTVRIWDPRNLVLAKAPVSRANFSPDGASIVAGGADGSVRIYRTDLSDPPAVLPGHSGVCWARFLPDSRGVVSSGRDGTVQVWTGDRQAPPRVFALHRGPVWVTAAHPRGDRILSGGDDGRLVLTSLVDGTSTVVVDDIGAIYDTAFSPDGRYVMAAGKAGELIVQSVDRPADRPTVGRGHVGPIYSAAFSRDGTRIVTGGTDGAIRVWTLPIDAAAPLTITGHRGAVESVRFSSDGSRVVSTGIDGTVRVWDAGSGHQLAVVHRHDGSASSVDVSPDGEHIASVGSNDQTLRVYACEVCGPLAQVAALARARAAAG